MDRQKNQLSLGVDLGVDLEAVTDLTSEIETLSLRLTHLTPNSIQLLEQILGRVRVVRAVELHLN